VSIINSQLEEAKEQAERAQRSGDLNTAAQIQYGRIPELQRKLADVPSFGVIALSLATVAVIYAPIAGLSVADNDPTTKSVLAVITLALVCTGLAFVVFFKLLDEIGPARAPLITFANPVVAVALGALLLDEEVTIATLVGFVLVMTGCWLATKRPSDMPAVELSASVA